MVYETIVASLREHMATMPVIDTHEHLPIYEAEETGDVLYNFLIHYLSCDLKTAGLPIETHEKVVLSHSVPIMEKWKAVEPYWEYARHTGYGRSVALAARAIYDIDAINADSIELLNERFLALRGSGRHYDRVLRDLCHIETSILDGWRDDGDPKYFSIASNIGSLVCGDGGDLFAALARIGGRPVRTLEDMVDVVQSYVSDRLVNKKSVCLKCSLAYERSIYFAEASYSEAQADLARMRTSKDPRVWKDCTHLQNYLMHALLTRLNELGGILQVHTGLQEGNGNHLEYTNPMLLTNLFLAYPNVTFDLFHIGYPFQGITAALCKNFPNVMIDMCWAHIISPIDARQALSSFLDAVPYNKISAFGGDYGFVDGVYGHLQIAKDNVAKVLADKAVEGILSEADAKGIATHLFYKNPKRIFRI